ncbi:1-acyl-sn-glycerol-3-phosphate acyltransferase [Albidovulum inexpectatum]|uniref:1-acyl-sn-glycerol-3-phosphate acyltransferase n=1 Tax=Albidovulum inexpectatum TaxID=196587 RepID=A0A2S5JGL9_9RHOB|nr:lysophospholipid acyltransferase family protein [Albidovulum inexpectatum]PPB80541.1 1-acyl-sn-glycerol-3-phosphate acyltransferase [Albidovulum inexpectatum]
MRLILQYILSMIFIVQMYLMMAIYALYWTPRVMFRREAAYDAVHAYCNWVRWSAAAIVGLRSEIRGEVPTDEVLIAAKHQSFFDIILIVSAVPRPKFIMKKELLWAPIVGWYARKIGCVPVDRGKRGQAIRRMLAEVKAGRELPGQLIIYPQGTRVAAGARRPYKVGVGILYSQLGQDCVPAATNVGVFWPRHGILRKPGLAVVEFLPRIPAGLPVEEFMARIEPMIEEASDRLMEEAGFVLPDRPRQPADA